MNQFQRLLGPWGALKVKRNLRLVARTDDWVEGRSFQRIALTKGKFVIVDDADYKVLSRYRWQISIQGYASIGAYNPAVGLRRKLFMHRLLLKTPIGMYTDHINRNRLDCRRSNLRIVDRFQNAQNIKDDGFRGVNQEPNGKWRAKVKHRGKDYSAGTFFSKQEAAQAALKKRRELGFLEGVK